MSFLQTVFLAAIAGFTIYLGLPFGRNPGNVEANAHLPFDDFSRNSALPFL